MTTTLTQRLERLRQFYQRYQRLPSYSEMMDLFGWHSKNAAYRFIQNIKQAGFIQQDRLGKLTATTKLIGTKVLGEIAAGFPSPAEEELADVMRLDQYLIEHPSSTFMVRVSGDSMIEAGIQPNDLVIVERQRSPKPNDIVIALVDDAWTMKRFVKQGQRTVLLAANKKYRPIYPITELKIEGVVVGVVRKYH